MVPLEPHRRARLGLGRRLGQHFLARKSILERIASAACGGSEPVPLVIEIGPGRGALTECLLERAQRVVAIEIDAVLVHYLNQKFREAAAEGRLQIVEGDVLKTDLAAFGPQPAIAGNLPYYITSPILERVFDLQAGWRTAVFLVQEEVANRIAASPGTRDFGYLSVLAQTRANVEKLFAVPREAFRPPPKVESAVIRLTPRDAGIADVQGFLRFAQACFRHKRKTLRNNLADVYGGARIEALPESRMRAEQLGVAQLMGLYQKLTDAPNHSQA